MDCDRPHCPYDADRDDLRHVAREMAETAAALRILAEDWRAADAPQRLTRLETEQVSIGRRLDWHQRAAIGVVSTVAAVVAWFGGIKGWW